MSSGEFQELAVLMRDVADLIQELAIRVLLIETNIKLLEEEVSDLRG